VSVPAIKSCEAQLRKVHNFLLVLLKVQVQCERVSDDSGLEHPPVLMARVLDVLSTITADLLDAWAGAVAALQECASQKALVRQNALAEITCFADKIAELMKLSLRGEEDETLGTILDVTEAFAELF
jgi:hypothetical protein